MLNYNKNSSLSDKYIDPYIKKAQYLARLGRFNEAIIVYEALLEKN